MADIFYYYGEIREARKMAREIVHARKTKEIVTTEDLKKSLVIFLNLSRINFFYTVVPSD